MSDGLLTDGHEMGTDAGDGLGNETGFAGSFFSSTLLDSRKKLYHCMSRVCALRARAKAKLLCRPICPNLLENECKISIALVEKSVSNRQAFWSQLFKLRLAVSSSWINIEICVLFFNN